ncbi:hypothetical protein F5Y15DRAFT_56000 [Xylariaceae sp. FL0016]|nr:hypothetical protein F5Y15DRAFT_56000 [Xylariaceae sp. FL0016]
MDGKEVNAKQLIMMATATQEYRLPMRELQREASVHRKRASLRNDLIKTGNYNTRNGPADYGGMPPLNYHDPTRRFFVPKHLRPRHPSPPQRTRPAQPTPPGLQPDRELATSATPTHQLHYPQALRLAVNEAHLKWTQRSNRPEAAWTVLHVTSDGKPETLHIFESLQDANADALTIMMRQSPSAFAVECATREGDASGTTNANVKVEEPERATSVIRIVEARPTQVTESETVRVSENVRESGRDMKGRDMATAPLPLVTETHVRLKSEDQEDRRHAENVDGMRPVTNQRGEILLDAGPEKKFVYWGKWKIEQHGLKMSAHMLNGVVTKVRVGLRNVRKPKTM